MANEMVPVLRGTVLEEEGGFTLEQLCRLCRLKSQAIITMVEEGILDPEGEEPVSWRFPGSSVTHVRIVVRLQRDLGVNLEGAALVLEEGHRVLVRLADQGGRDLRDAGGLVDEEDPGLLHDPGEGP